MWGFVSSWTSGGLQQQQQGRVKQLLLLLLVAVMDGCVAVSVSTPFIRSTSARTSPAVTSFVEGASPWQVLKTAFLVPASRTRSASSINVFSRSPQAMHVSCLKMDKQTTLRNGRPEVITNSYCSPWLCTVSCTHQSRFKKPLICGGPLTVVMRAHVRRSHSRLGRPRSHRKALLRNLATQLIRHGSIITTAAKGKELRRVIDSKIILAKKGGLHNYRQALGFFYDKKLTRKLFQEAPTRFARRNNGFSRCTRLPFPRLGDAAKICRVELLD